MAKRKIDQISYTSDITITKEGRRLDFKGPSGTVNINLPEGIEVDTLSGLLKVGGLSDVSKKTLTISLLQNAVSGVKTPWSKSLEMVGVGFRAQTDGKLLTLNVGFSHPVLINAPEGIVFKVAENKITVSGADKYLVGETAAKVRRVKPPEPYKGKGIRYEGEIIRKKLGKAAKAVGGATGAK